MDTYRKFIIEAKIGGAKGFGAPEKAPSKKPSKEEIAVWRSRSKKYREDYLKKHPNSKYKDVPERGSIVTRSKKISNKPEAKAVSSSAALWLAALGVKNKGNNREHAKKIMKHLGEFLGAKNRAHYIDSAKEHFSKFYNKLKPKDKSDVEDEAKDIINNPRETPSKVLDRKGKKGKLAALIGLATAAAVLGGMATGFLPVDVISFMGIKVLDTAVEAIRGMGNGDGFGDTFITLLAGSAIAGFLKSKDSDEYLEDVHSKMKKNFGDEEDDSNDSDNTEDAKVADTEDNSNKPPEKDTSKDLKKLGIELDPDKYEQNSEGNWVRKKATS